MNTLITRITLTGSGAILTFIGGALMVAPKTFLEMSDVIVDRDPGLMSEVTAPSGVLLVTGALMIFGAVKSRFAQLGLMIGAIVYASYGFGRVVSIVLHGMPSGSLVAAMIVELGLAALLIFVSLRDRTRPDGWIIDFFRGEVIV